MSCFGRDSTAEEIARAADLRGRQIVLTGASSGIGAETARTLALTGAELVLGVRDVAAGTALVSTFDRDAQNRIKLWALDLSDLASVEGFARHVSGPVDILINNAGVSKTPNAHLPNGLDVRFATNHLGHFVLAHLLYPQMKLRGARIVVLSSAAHKGCPVHLDDLGWTKRAHVDGLAYAESKSANILFAQEATQRWGDDRIFANAVLPGSVMTGLQRFHGEALKRRIGFIREDGSLDPHVKTVECAAATSVWAAIAPEMEGRGGLVLEDCAEALIAGPDTHAWSGFDPSVTDPEIARGLWAQSLDLARALGFEHLVEDL